METNNDLTPLQNIHDLLVDSQKGYQEASDRAEDPRVKSLLATFSLERTALEAEVDAHLHQLDPQARHHDGGTIKGDMHRAWMDIRDALSTTDNANVLSECERGEGYLLMRYDELLKKDDIGGATRALAERQRAMVQANVSKIKELRRHFDRVES